MDETSFTLGWLVGRRIAGQRSKQKTPIAYLYNGVQLPPLPEWDRETYPYAFILWVGGFIEKYYLYLTPEIIHRKSNSGEWCIGYADGSMQYFAADGNWTALGEIQTGGLADVITAVTWANFDVLHEDGTLYLAASEPIPVYE